MDSVTTVYDDTNPHPASCTNDRHSVSTLLDLGNGFLASGGGFKDKNIRCVLNICRCDERTTPLPQPTPPLLILR